jgi:protein subunit release factor A
MQSATGEWGSYGVYCSVWNSEHSFKVWSFQCSKDSYYDLPGYDSVVAWQVSNNASDAQSPASELQKAMLQKSRVVYRYERGGHRVYKLPTTDSEGDVEDMAQARQMVTTVLHLTLCQPERTKA